MTNSSLRPLKESGDFKPRLQYRHRVGMVAQWIFFAATLLGILVLSVLLVTIVNDVAGYAAIESKIPLDAFTAEGEELASLSREELVRILRENVSAGLYRRFESETPPPERSVEELTTLITRYVIEPQVAEQWTLLESLLQRDEIRQTVAEEHPDAELRFVNWLDLAFITDPQAADAVIAGVRTAILGTIWVVGIAFLFSFPIGVGAAIYLEEYAGDSLINRIIQVNINNLSGVPSIIYGILGLSIFVRALIRITSGVAFGYGDPTSMSGRTVLSAGLTLGLLILPLIIINSQEAIRAVPVSLREAAYGLGATRWQTIWHHVLPQAVTGILTGTILAVSRAVGETAPLVVVGATTYITSDPDSPFSQFTTLPIQIYQWTTRPQDVFRNLAAAAIVVLLILGLSLNATAILLRNRFSRRI